MAGNKTSQRFVFKINSKRIIDANYDLSLSLEEARRNGELISLSESQMMRRIDYLNNIQNLSQSILHSKNNIKRYKKMEDIQVSKPLIKEEYQKLDQLLFKKDYICIVIDKPNDYRTLCEHGFYINGISFHRMLGTPGGIKKNTVVFVNSNLWENLNEFINCGRDLSKAFVPAKLEAYKALVCSSSEPVSSPNGVLVVHDCITHFKEEVILLDDRDTDEPVMTSIPDYEITLDNSDGYGMASPELMRRWSEDLNLDYMIPGCVIRNAFCKGAVYPFDFKKFCREYNVEYVRDVWGQDHKIENIELVLTESMLKLWDSYDSIDDYLGNCKKYGYSFCITKTSEENLENQRTLNYQFIQSYDFDDDDIEELTRPTINEIKDIMKMDYKKTILYSGGVGLNESSVKSMENNFTKALMIEPKCIDDPYIQSQISGMINRRIDRAKVGVLNFDANYALVLGDPYALCQSMCGFEITGLLKAGEVYSKYWLDKCVDEISIFRAPMTSHNNIRKMKVVTNSKIDEYFEFLATPTVFNCWDNTFSSENGMDADGDCTINTCNSLLVKKTKNLPAIECIQKKGNKIVPNDDDLMESNISSFGNEVGAITNRATSMFDVQSRFSPDSEEYKILDYRIKCGQLYQQNAIDSAKGIVVKPMPKYWYQRYTLKITDEDTEEEKAEKSFNKRILADKKPYFMQYIYPEYKKEMQEYVSKVSGKCIMQFGKTIDELLSSNNQSEDEKKFVKYYYLDMPLNNYDCVVNKIARKIENEITEFKISLNKKFDFSIYKDNSEYSNELYDQIFELYKKYQSELSEFMMKANRTRIKDEERILQKYLLVKDFKEQCYLVCPNEKVLTNIVIDICYKKNNDSKRFAWDMCGNVIIDNLLKKNGYKLTYPELDSNGDITFNGEHFRMKSICIEEVDDDYDYTE